MNKRFQGVISLALGTALSGGALYFAFRNVPFSELTDYFKSIDYLWIIPAIVLSMLSFFFRTLRWQTILSSSYAVGFWQAFHPLMVAFMVNSILPGRVGELARPVILQKRDQIPFTTGFATVAVERIFDLAMLLLLFTLVLSTVEIDPNYHVPFGQYQLNREILQQTGKGMVAASIIMLSGILMISFEKPKLLIHMIILNLPQIFFFTGKAFQEKMRSAICERLIKLTENIASGFLLIRYPKKIFFCIIDSAAVWGLQAISFYLVSLGCPDIGLSVLQITAVLVIQCFFIALPSVPGFWGLWEAGGVFAMGLFGITQASAGGYSLVNHAAQMFPVIIVGIGSALVTGYGFSGFRKQNLTSDN